MLVLPVPAALAQECPANAAVPRSVEVAYSADGTDRYEVVFRPGADGTLRAVEKHGGGALWSFTPPELDGTHREDGLMSELRILRFDANRDGVIDRVAGDRLWLYFGMRRGGRYYYALDATDRGTVRVLWRAGPGELPGIGETWSPPVIARVRVNGEAQNGEHLVVIVGGGHDEVPGSAHRLYMLDAESGELLWYAGGPGGIEAPQPPDLLLAAMTSSLPPRIAVVDTDSDALADRMYAADSAGRVWRFDIWNGRERAGLVTGGLLASLGAAASADPTEARRFFNGPDVALVRRTGRTPYYNLALGSGDRSRPFDTEVHDRLYAIRDMQPFGKFPQSAYDARVPILDTDLLDITDAPGTAVVPPGAPGWKLDLRDGTNWRGEKTLAEAVTANGTILYTTFEPMPASTCADTARNRVYALRLEEGHPARDLDEDGHITDRDVSSTLDQHGIAGEVELERPSGRHEPPNPGEAPHTPESAFLRCAVGGERLRFCVSMESLQRTFWHRQPPPD